MSRSVTMYSVYCMFGYCLDSELGISVDT